FLGHKHALLRKAAQVPLSLPEPAEEAGAPLPRPVARPTRAQREHAERQDRRAARYAEVVALVLAACFIRSIVAPVTGCCGGRSAARREDDAGRAHAPRVA